MAAMQEPSTLSVPQPAVLCILRELGENVNCLDFFIYMVQFSIFKFWYVTRIKEGF